MGVLTSFSSYNKKEKPIIVDAHIVPLLNSSVSFFAGFAVFTIIGYLKTTYPDQEANSSSFALAFEAYPTALLEIKGSNFWCLLLFLTLFMLGLDSAFSYVEAFSTVIYDVTFAKKEKKYRRELIAGIICIIGFLFSLPFCMNTGLIWMNTVDHYLSNYLMQVLGIF
jgi:SNF family Na+-dependent transporter